MNTPRATLTDVLARLGFASRAGLLTILIALLWTMFYWPQRASGDPVARQALDLAAAVCWLGSLMALSFTSIGVEANRVPQLALVRVLLATFARLVPPLAVVTLAAAQQWRVLDGGLGGYLIVFYLAALAFDTVFALPAVLGLGGTKAEAA